MLSRTAENLYWTSRYLERADSISRLLEVAYRISLIPNTQDEEMNSDIDITKFESVDEIVAKEIEAIESDSFDKSKLLSIYRDLSKDD